MADKASKSAFTTVYEGEDTGTVGFSRREEVEADVVAYLEVLGQLKEDFADEPEVVEGLKDVEVQLVALRMATESSEEVQKRLRELITIPLSEGKSVRLDAFRKKSAQATLSGDNAYRERVGKLVRNTVGNLTHLLLTWPDDAILLRFTQELSELDMSGEMAGLKQRMEGVGKSPHLFHYNEKKKEFLIEWLRPFQEELGKAIQDLSPEELQASIKKVEQMRERKLEEMAHMELESDRAAFRVHNRAMHPVMNGKDTDFWGSTEVRDEFIALMGKLLTRFSLTLEDRFLLFKGKEGGFCYLIGFADEAFTETVDRADGSLGVYPHLKAFLADSSGNFNEIRPEAYAGDTTAYYRALKTAVVPFLSAMSVMVEHVLSPQLKETFDMWT